MIYSLLYDRSTPVALYSQLKLAFNNKITMLFESAINNEDGNFSFITIGAKERITYKDNITIYTDANKEVKELNESPFEFLKEYYSKIDGSKYKDIANRLGFNYIDGFIGYIGYDMVKVFEPTLKKVMDNLEDETNIPDLDMVRPELIIVFAHKKSKLYILDFDNTQKELVNKIFKILSEPFKDFKLKKADLSEGKFAFSKDEFMKIVEMAKEHIRAGDVFQMLPSNRFTQKGYVDPLSFYRVLRSKNPSPYMFLLDFNDFVICGSSPEVMVRLTDGEILLRPIAGTRKRGKTPQQDYEMEQELINDPKERAEHLMLIDLGRNDVGRVAKVGTVKVQDMMHVERYSHVMHMVSDVVAKIRDDKDMFDLFASTFTAGTMTGAPKIKAMELIAKYEKLKRGFYSGSVGYFSFTKDMDSAIAIRTALLLKDRVILQAGAGVVADSIPKLEELEVRNKLMALVKTLQDLQNLDENQKLPLLEEIDT